MPEDELVDEAPATPQPASEPNDRRAQTAARVTDRNDRDAARASAAAERSGVREDERRRRAEAKAATRGDAEERKAAQVAVAAAAEEKMRAKKDAQKHRSDAKQQAKTAKAQAKSDAKAARLEAKNQAKEDKAGASRRAQEARKQAEGARTARAQEAKAEEARPTAVALGGAAAAVAERALVEAAEATKEDEASPPTTTDEPAVVDTQQDAGPDRAPELDATQPIGRVQVDDVPEAEPKKPRTGVRSAAIMVAAVVGALGLVFSVVLAVGALIVAIGAGEGNSIYDPLSTVCDALVGPLKNAFNFTGPNAASREEFLGWGAGSLIYLAVSFAGQAAHRAATRD